MHVPPLRFLKLSRYELDFKGSILFSSIYGSGARFVDVHQGVRLLEFERASNFGPFGRCRLSDLSSQTIAKF